MISYTQVQWGEKQRYDVTGYIGKGINDMKRNFSDLFLIVGTVLPRGTTGAKILPSIATPRDRGTTSRSRRSAVSADVALPERIPAWTAAP